MQQPTNTDERRRSIPAWLTSVVLHAIILILAVLFIRATPRSANGEAERAGSIVLSRTNATGQEEYFDEADAAASAAAASQTQADVTDALPTEAEATELKLPDIELPGAMDGGALSTDALLPSTDLSGGTPNAVLPSTGDAAILAEEAAMRAARGAAVPPTQLSIFGSGPAVGASFVFVIDRSKSMGSDGLDVLSAAHRELGLAVANLEAHHKFQIIAYHHETEFLDGQRKLLRANDKNRGMIAKYFGGLAAFGGTEHMRGIRSALHLRPDAIFLLADGGDPHLTAPQLAEIKNATKGRTKIHCIQFGFGPLQDDDPFMRTLALQNGGNFRYVDVSKR